MALRIARDTLGLLCDVDICSLLGSWGTGAQEFQYQNYHCQGGADHAAACDRPRRIPVQRTTRRGDARRARATRRRSHKIPRWMMIQFSTLHRSNRLCPWSETVPDLVFLSLHQHEDFEHNGQRPGWASGDTLVRMQGKISSSALRVGLMSVPFQEFQLSRGEQA